MTTNDPELVSMAQRLNEQVTTLYQQGKYAEAIPLAERALKITKNALGPNHPDVATDLNNLASLYYAQGRFSDAESLYKQAKEIVKNVLGEEHPYFATSLNNLAELYRVQGRFSDAEPLYKQALEIRKKVLPGGHPDIAQSLNNLAGLYASMALREKLEPQRHERHREGNRCFKRASEISEKVIKNIFTTPGLSERQKMEYLATIEGNMNAFLSHTAQYLNPPHPLKHTPLSPLDRGEISPSP